MEKGGNDNVSFTKYRDVGFGIDSGHQDGAINAYWNTWHLQHRVWLHDGLSFHLVVGFFGLGSAQWCEGDLQGLEGMVAYGFTAFDVCFVAHSAFILLMIRSVSWLQVAGLALRCGIRSMTATRGLALPLR